MSKIENLFVIPRIKWGKRAVFLLILKRDFKTNMFTKLWGVNNNFVGYK